MLKRAATALPMPSMRIGAECLTLSGSGRRLPQR